MALPVFSSGMNHRKIKTPPAQARNGATLDQSDGKFSGKALFRGTKHRMAKVDRTTLVFLTVVVSGATLTWLWWLSHIFSLGFSFNRLANPGWGKHPRVSTILVELEAAMGHVPVQVRLEDMPRQAYTVPPLASAKFFKQLLDSDSYDEGRADQFETETCKAQYDWQIHSFPACNHLHEREMQAMTVRPENKDGPLRLVANGYWRDVWILPPAKYDSERVLKTIRYEHTYEERNYDRHRRDALAMERLTSHPFVMDIYAYCGNSGIFEFASGGDISDAIWPRDSNGHKKSKSGLTEMQRLHMGKYD